MFAYPLLRAAGCVKKKTRFIPYSLHRHPPQHTMEAWRTTRRSAGSRTWRSCVEAVRSYPAVRHHYHHHHHLRTQPYRQRRTVGVADFALYNCRRPTIFQFSSTSTSTATPPPHEHSPAGFPFLILLYPPIPIPIPLPCACVHTCPLILFYLFIHSHLSYFCTHTTHHTHRPPPHAHGPRRVYFYYIRMQILFFLAMQIFVYMDLRL